MQATSEPPTPSPLDLSDKLKTAQHLKNQGNQHFKNKQYPQALASYHKANLYAAGIQTSDSPYYSYSKQKLATPQQTLLKDLKFSIYMNMGQVYIIQKKFDKAVAILEKAAGIKVTSKLYYRRATAYMYSSKFEEARRDLELLREGDGSEQAGKDVEAKLTELKGLEKVFDQKASVAYKKMFS